MTYFVPEELLPPPKQSWRSVLSKLSHEEQERILANLREEEIVALNQDWFLTARREQFPPSHDNWFIWILQAGRGFGKNFAGANWIINEHQFGGAKNSAIIAATSGDLRRNCIDGPSGIMNIAPTWFRPDYKPTQNKLVWPNGTETHTYTSEKPERLRGPNHDRAWGDELSYWRYAHQVWDNLMMTMRYGSDNKFVITMTPRPIEIVKRLEERAKLDNPDTIFSRGSSYDNLANLSGEFAETIKRYKGTHLERQEIFGEYTGDVDGALWSRELIEQNRRDEVPSKLTRIVVGVDPAMTGGEYADETGIVVAGLVGGKDPHAYVLGDYSMKGSPSQWARKVAQVYGHHKANLIVAERNQGGELVSEVLKNVDAGMPIKLIHAKVGKVARAEPVALLDEQHRIHHIGVLPELEDQMCVAWDTFVLTPKGNKPIFTLREGDYVITRKGPKKILWSGNTGINAVLCINGLNATPNHPILCDDKFVRADQIKGRILKCFATIPNTSSSDLMLLMMGCGSLGGLKTATGRQVVQKENLCYIATSGKNILAPSQMVILFIMWTKTETITASKTCNVLLLKNTKQFMETLDGQFRQVNRDLCLQKRVGRLESSSRRNVRGAENFTLPHMEEVDIVAESTRDSETGVVSASSLKTLTWNLSIEGCPEFFANNILVHNCLFVPGDMKESPDRVDARVYALTELLVKSRRGGTWGRSVRDKILRVA